jgi:hypothetical protein
VDEPKAFDHAGKQKARRGIPERKRTHPALAHLAQCPPDSARLENGRLELVAIGDQRRGGIFPAKDFDLMAEAARLGGGEKTGGRRGLAAK